MEIKSPILLLILVIFITFTIFAGSNSELAEPTTLTNKTLLLATTTSTRDSGLLDHIIGNFESETGITVKVIAVGTGKALQMGRDGEADCLLVHAKTSEEKFVAEGYGTERHDVMYNDFIIVGPPSDEASVKTKSPNNVVEGLKIIKLSNSKFISRGDDSGTHKKEIILWKTAGVIPEGKSYYSVGKGMGDVLVMASELQAYTMTDRATYLFTKDKLELDIVIEKDDILFNQYGVIPVNPEINNQINSKAAKLFVSWLLSKETQNKIGKYGLEKFGMPLFTANAKEGNP